MELQKARASQWNLNPQESSPSKHPIYLTLTSDKLLHIIIMYSNIHISYAVAC